MGNQSDPLAASADPRNPWWELRTIRLLTLRDELAETPPPALNKAA